MLSFVCSEMVLGIKSMSSHILSLLKSFQITHIQNSVVLKSVPAILVQHAAIHSLAFLPMFLARVQGW